MENTQILKVTIESTHATYVAEGNDAQSWREWMLRAETFMKEKGDVWDSWTSIQEKELVEPKEGPQFS